MNRFNRFKKFTDLTDAAANGLEMNPILSPIVPATEISVTVIAAVFAVAQLSAFSEPSKFPTEEEQEEAPIWDEHAAASSNQRSNSARVKRT